MRGYFSGCLILKRNEKGILLLVSGVASRTLSMEQSAIPKKDSHVVW